MILKGGITMENINIEEIKEVYEKLGIPINDESVQQDISLLNNWNSVPFGIYTENGFNFSNNTNS